MFLFLVIFKIVVILNSLQSWNNVVNVEVFTFRKLSNPQSQLSNFYIVPTLLQPIWLTGNTTHNIWRTSGRQMYTQKRFFKYIYTKRNTHHWWNTSNSCTMIQKDYCIKCCIITKCAAICCQCTANIVSTFIKHQFMLSVHILLLWV